MIKGRQFELNCEDKMILTIPLILPIISAQMDFRWSIYERAVKVCAASLVS